MIKIELPNLPVAWSAARITDRGAFNPRSKQKNFTRWQIRSMYKEPPISGYVVLEFVFIFPVPNSASKKNKQKMLSGELLPTSCDCTNLQKFQEDCLKGIVITDDRNVAKISSEKIYGDKEKILMKIWINEFKEIINAGQSQ